MIHAFECDCSRKCARHRALGGGTVKITAVGKTLSNHPQRTMDALKKSDEIESPVRCKWAPKG